MTKRILGTTAGVLFAAAGLQAQGVGVGVGGGIGGGVGRGGAAGALIEQFQQAGTFTAVGAGRGAMTVSAYSNQTVLGRPVSGMEERKSTQTLGDGTEISTSQNELFYRDSAGRTRREMPSQNRTVIYDPVARVTITLNTETKIANRLAMPAGIEPPRMGTAVSEKTATAAATEMRVVSTATGTATYAFNVGDGPYATTVTTGGPIAATAPRRVGGSSENMRHEDLGVESLNSVLATHTRDTLTIPQGQIGNNRDINVVNERWYSDDLQMLVKTVNSDPRFGQNTYELTNVSRDEPNPSLFQIPGDYTIRETGRGVVLRDIAPPVKQ